jgi:hypothetical protein
MEPRIQPENEEVLEESEELEEDRRIRDEEHEHILEHHHSREEEEIESEETENGDDEEGNDDEKSEEEAEEEEAEEEEAEEESESTDDENAVEEEEGGLYIHKRPRVLKKHNRNEEIGSFLDRQNVLPHHDKASMVGAALLFSGLALFLLAQYSGKSKSNPLSRDRYSKRI